MASSSLGGACEVRCSVSVAGAMTLGTAHVMNQTLVWRPVADGVLGERLVNLAHVTGHQRNKPGAPRASLRLVLQSDKSNKSQARKPEAFVMQFGDEKSRDALSDVVKRATAVSGNGSPGVSRDTHTKNARPSNAELAARHQILTTNAALAAAHGRLVKGSKYADSKTSQNQSIAAIDDDEFWAARAHLFTDAVLKHGSTQQLGISNVLDADIKGARTGTGETANGAGDVVTAVLSNEKMHRIFAERPAVRSAFLTNVPSRMTEREFWTRFLRSEYFKAARAGAPPQGEEEAADLALFARRAQTKDQRSEVSKRLTPSCNLAADSFDFGVFGTAGDQTAELGATDGEKGRGGHGIFRDGAKEPPPPSASVAVAAAKALGGRGGGKAAAAKHAAIETLRSLNHHAQVVLRGRPLVPVTDARSAALAAEAQEGLEKNATNYAMDTSDEFVLEDLLDQVVQPKKHLHIDDPSRYFSLSGKHGEVGDLHLPEAKRAKKHDVASDAQFDFSETISRLATEMGGVSRGTKPVTKTHELVKQTPTTGTSLDRTPPVSFSELNANEIDVAASRSVLDELSSTARRWRSRAARNASSSGDLRSGNSEGSRSAKPEPADTDGLPVADQHALGEMEPTIRSDANAAAELLRHFWSAAPLVSVEKWRKATRVVTALGSLYDQMEARKKTLPPAARHKLSGRLRPLTNALDNAFSFFDDEKKVRAGAFARFEAEATGADAEGGKAKPIEVS